MNYNLKNEDSSGFKFALTIIISAATIFITLISYLQNNPLPIEIALIVFSTISLSLILILIFLLYVFLKGLSFEASSESKDIITKMASLIYVFNYYFIIIYLPLVIACLIFIILKSENIFIFAIIFLLGLLIIWYFNSIISPIKLPRFLIIVLFFVCFFFWVFSTGITTVLFQYSNPTEIDVKDIYYYDDIIPINLKIKDGINDNISISLMQEGADNSLQEIDSFRILFSYDNTYHGKRMFGNSNFYGEYRVYISTNNMTTGYYELFILKEKYLPLPSKKGFYFINHEDNNNTSFITSGL